MTQAAAQQDELLALGRSHLTAETARLTELARLASARLRTKPAR